MNVKLLAHTAAVVGALALVLFAAGTDSVSAEATFKPEFKLAISATEPESVGDTVVDFNLPEGDVNFAGIVAFIPNEWGIVTGDQITVGAKVGELTSVAVLGLIGGACNQALEPTFDMLNATIDITKTVSFEDLDENNTRDYADDADDDGIPNAVEMYPEFISRLFEGQADLQPIRRSAAITPVAGIPVLLQFLVFEPGTLISDEIPHGEELGFPSVTLLQNAGDPDVIPAPGAITDFCSPLTSHNEAYGVSQDNEESEGVDESGETLQVTPKDGKYNFAGFAFGQRDADGDSYENSLDTCPYTVNDGSPRISYDGDLDGDGLDSACDPSDDPASGTNSDQDGDGYLNRQDNCPLFSNGEDATNQNDLDRDQIGDPCDTNPGTIDGDDTTADGALIPLQTVQEVTIGTGAGPAGPPSNEAGSTCDGKCWTADWTVQPPPTGGTGPPTDTPTDTGPTPSPTDDDGNGDGGSSIGLIIGIIVAAVVVVGGGGFLLMRRRGS